MNLTFHTLSEIPPRDLVALLNDQTSRGTWRCPVLTWTEAAALEWAAAKDHQWIESGYGPWAIRVDGVFAGWGGYQKEREETDLGLVLLPNFWGVGIAIFREMLARGRALPLGPVTILLPPSRTRMKGLARLGFVPAGELGYAGHRFLKFGLVR